MNARCSNHRPLADAFAAALYSLSASQGERAGVRCFFGTGDPEFIALGKAITILLLK